MAAVDRLGAVPTPSVAAGTTAPPPEPAPGTPLAPSPTPMNRRAIDNPLPRLTPPRQPLKPGPYRNWSAAQSQVQCNAIATNAARRGVSTLVIAYEGLLSFDSAGTEAAYADAQARPNGGAHGPRPQPSLMSGGGFVLHELMEPMIDRFGDHFELMVFPHLAGGVDGSVPNMCARAWMADPSRHLVVVGHSLGNNAVDELARSLSRTKTPIDVVMMLDAPGGLRKQSSTRELLDFRQPHWDTLAGSPIAGAQVDTFVANAHHTSLPGAPEVRAALATRLEALIDK